MIITSPTGTGG